MSRTRWTLESLGDDDDDDIGSLPQLKEISRAALAAPDFSVYEFLTEYSQFRTLKDVQKLVAEWETKLESELSQTVNSTFSEFVNALESTQNGEPFLKAVRSDLRKFGQQAEQLRSSVGSIEAKLTDELETHRMLTAEEARARKLLHLVDLLSELESAVPEIEATNGRGLIVLSKSYVALACIAHDMPTAKAISVLKVSIDNVYRELKQKLERSLAEKSNENCKLELLEAREFLLASAL